MVRGAALSPHSARSTPSRHPLQRFQRVQPRKITPLPGPSISDHRTSISDSARSTPSRHPLQRFQRVQPRKMTQGLSHKLQSATLLAGSRRRRGAQRNSLEHQRAGERSDQTLLSDDFSNVRAVGAMASASLWFWLGGSLRTPTAPNSTRLMFSKIVCHCLK